MTILEILHQYLDAGDVKEDTFRAVAEISHLRNYQAGDVIYRENEHADHLGIVTAGQVDVQYLLCSGKRQTVDTLNPGDFLLWSAIIKPHTTSSIGICRVKSEVVAIEGAGLRDICEQDTRFGYQLTSQLARVVRRRLQAARLQIADMN